MTINIISCITQTASFLKLPPGKITLDLYSIPVRSENNLCITGFVPIVFDLLRQANSNLIANDVVTKAELRQWLEYITVYVLRANTVQDVNQILKELNNVLSTKTYLVNYNVSIADVLMFYALHHIMIQLSYLDKEKYLNISRWFDNLQQHASIRQKHKLISFKTNYLTIIAPAK